MRDVRVAGSIRGARPDTTLFERIGAFLDEQKLSPDPAHYAFAYAVMSAPGSELAAQVAALTQDGVRLTRSDIERLGGMVIDGPPPGQSRRTSGAADTNPVPDTAIALVIETQQQVDGFVQIVRTIQAETHGFGRELAKSAASITQLAEIDEIAEITSAMIARIHDSEVRLAAATAEADSLRSKLIEACDTARRDVLTGLPNRRAFEEAFATRDRDAGPYCLALCDIDRFKRINDVHGHGVGDRVLTAIGQAMAAECAPHLVVRHGGEEFAVLLGGIALAEAADMLDSVRATVAAKRFRNRETDTALGVITVSAGVTAIHADEAAETAFQRADQLLYTAKKDGRDRVCAG
ncbi:diguanylate cyclase [Sphingomonas sp. PP-CE-1A-559]|uniref:GGDEF domain-containing protein n=1 Tax=Sphingomonas sp. PP-CE-1A-559 TaxID=2135657 RepID=UPI001056DB45|nr:GGDEF domain-containing protein [Sphingomonas sp. PP-CE-1A-559]TCP88638.1 diguanylate cyclase [Sphingomonas sp. PP-CE-1A-559]